MSYFQCFKNKSRKIDKQINICEIFQSISANIFVVPTFIGKKQKKVFFKDFFTENLTTLNYYLDSAHS